MESMFSSNRPGWAALLDEKVTAYLPDLKYVHDEPLARHTSFRIGGPATRMAFPTSGDQIVLLTGFAQECGVTPFLLGNGTNLLVADEGLDTLVIQTGEGLNRIALDGGIITADAGVSLARLGVFAWQHSLTGLEFAHGIPGSLGGGVVMNAGAYGGELKDVLTEVTALFPDGVRTLRGEELALGYRRSFFTDHPEAVVLRAKLALHGGDQEAIKARMEELSAKRRASQPLEMPSARQHLQAPRGILRGHAHRAVRPQGRARRRGRGQPQARGLCGQRRRRDLRGRPRALKKVQDTVFTATGVTLEPEVKIIR